MYRKLRNRCTNLTREAKKQFITAGINNAKGNSKDMWSILKNLLPCKPHSDIASLDVGGNIITAASDIANHFNSFFVNIGQNLAAKIPSTSASYSDYLNILKKPTAKFTFRPVTCEEVLHRLNELSVNKATGLDNIQAKLLKTTSSVIASSVTYLFNLSLQRGKFPSDWKTARISALFKKGSKLDIGNYRPISILPVLSKCLEKLVHEQLYAYLSTNDLLAQQQSGFRPNHSTQTSLHYILEDFYSGLHKAKYLV